MANNKQIVFGSWENLENVANSLMQSIHSTLLIGSAPFFAYQVAGKPKGIIQLVIVKKMEDDKIVPNKFSVGMITPGFTSLVPNVPLEYIEKVVLEDLKKEDKKLAETLEDLIQDYRTEYGNK